MLEKPYEMAAVLKFVDVGPDLGLPVFVVDGRRAAGGATGMKGDWNGFNTNWRGPRQFHEDTADFLNLFALAQNVLVAQQVAKTEFAGLNLGLGSGVKGPYSARSCSVESHVIQKNSL